MKFYQQEIMNAFIKRIQVDAFIKFELQKKQQLCFFYSKLD